MTRVPVLESALKTRRKIKDLRCQADAFRETIDCPFRTPKAAMEIIRPGAAFVTQGKREYSPAHLADLRCIPSVYPIPTPAIFRCNQIMDDRWESEVIEYGAINITGFRIVDATRPHVKDFLAAWHRLDPATSQGAGRESISVRICSRITGASPARPRRHFFSRPSSVVVSGGFGRAFTACVQRGNHPPCEILGMPPGVRRFPSLGGSNISSGFFVFLEHFVELRRRPKFRTRNVNQTRIVADPVRTRDPGPHSFTHSSLCARWLETKLC